MSYILDALRRAEAERERGAVPGLHSQPLPGVAPESPRQASAGPWIAAGTGGAVLLLGALFWWMAERPAAPAAPAAVAAVPATTAPAAPAPAPVAQPAPPPPVVVVMQAPAPVPAPAPAPPPAAPPAAAPVAAEARIVAFDQLPDDVKRQLPTLAIGGAIYSERAADRLLIVGGQLLHEGDSAAPGVVLEKIKPRSAVLRWRELRYELTF